jgi:hypothetical protein
MCNLRSQKDKRLVELEGIRSVVTFHRIGVKEQSVKESGVIMNGKFKSHAACPKGVPFVFESQPGRDWRVSHAQGPSRWWCIQRQLGQPVPIPDCSLSEGSLKVKLRVVSIPIK